MKEKSPCLRFFFPSNKVIYTHVLLAIERHLPFVINMSEAAEAREAAGGDGSEIVDLGNVEDDDRRRPRQGRNINEAAMHREGYVEFRGRQVKGTLYKISGMSDEVQKRMHAYVHDGWIQKDLRYVREVFGLVNTSGRKDFELFWESPWIEEHIRDTPKKRKLEAQQRSMAVRSYIRASSVQVLHYFFLPLCQLTVDRKLTWSRIPKMLESLSIL